MGSREKGVMGLERVLRSHAASNRSRWQEPLSAVGVAREQHLATISSEVTLIKRGPVFPCATRSA